MVLFFDLNWISPQIGDEMVWKRDFLVVDPTISVLISFNSSTSITTSCPSNKIEKEDDISCSSYLVRSEGGLT